MSQLIHCNVKMPKKLVRDIEKLVKQERYATRSEVIRVAVRDLLKVELWNNGDANLLDPKWFQKLQTDLEQGTFSTLTQALNRMVAYYYRKGRDIHD